MKRQCGSCTLCCKLVPVYHAATDLTLCKPAGERCPFTKFQKGCRIHNTPKFPGCCRTWSCRWLTGDLPLDFPRPDKCGIVVDPHEDIIVRQDPQDGTLTTIPVVQAWIAHPRGTVPHPKGYISEYLGELAKRGYGILYRYDEIEGVFLWQNASTGNWEMAHETATEGFREKFGDG